MGEHKCNSCFYMQHERDKHPCNVCEGYNKYVNRNIYIHQPDTITIKTWDDEDAFDDYGGGSTLDDYPELKQDNINSPKHYMLFAAEDLRKDKGIEVRDVLEKLAAKIPLGECTTVPCKWDSTLFVSDYVQMMQYGMRFMEKNGQEDLKKMRWYLDKLIEAYERDNP